MDAPGSLDNRSPARFGNHSEESGAPDFSSALHGSGNGYIDHTTYTGPDSAGFSWPAPFIPEPSYPFFSSTSDWEFIGQSNADLEHVDDNHHHLRANQFEPPFGNQPTDPVIAGYFQSNQPVASGGTPTPGVPLNLSHGNWNGHNPALLEESGLLDQTSVGTGFTQTLQPGYPPAPTVAPGPIDADIPDIPGLPGGQVFRSRSMELF
jgi:hypothetical protein